MAAGEAKQGTYRSISALIFQKQCNRQESSSKSYWFRAHMRLLIENVLTRLLLLTILLKMTRTHSAVNEPSSKAGLRPLTGVQPGRLIDQAS